MKLFRMQRGDTIVEVLIATAVISMVVAASYSITNRNLANSRQSQEHVEALKIAQSQLEQLRSKAADTKAGDGVFRPSFASCFAMKDIASPTVVKSGDLIQFSPASIVPDGAASSYPAACRDIGTVSYRVGISYNDVQKVFTVYVNWDGATGGFDRVSLTYGAYPKQ